MVVMHSENEVDPILMNIVNIFDAYVNDASQRAYRIKSLIPSSPWIALWIQRATQYVETAIDNMLPAFYGYAVEELATNAIKYNFDRSYSGYTIFYQKLVGHTRPDIILKNDHDQSEAWLDITNHSSRNHIYLKDSKGWNEKYFVAEITYKDFNKDNIIPDDDIRRIDRTHALSVQRQLKLYEARRMRYFRFAFSNTLKELHKLGPSSRLTQSIVSSKVELCFKQPLSKFYKHPIIKSMIDIYSNGDVLRYATTFMGLKKLYSHTERNKSAAMAYINVAYKHRPMASIIY